MKSVIFKRFTKENAQTHVDNLSTGIASINLACVIFQRVARRFDGKCYNKRFIDAVNAELAKEIGTKTVNGFTYNIVRLGTTEMYTQAVNFRFYLLERSYTVPRGDYHQAVYFDDEICTDIACGLETCFDGKRIKASEFATVADKTMFMNVKRLKNWRDAVDNWDAYMRELCELDELIAERVGNINKMFISYDACMFVSSTRPIWGAKEL